MRTPDYDPRPVDPPAGPLTPLLIARQTLPCTWQHYAKAVPAARRYSHAADAPAAVQWQVALMAIKWGGHGNWSGTGCGYGT